MAYEMVMPYHLHMPSYFLETFTEYPFKVVPPGIEPFALVYSNSLSDCTFIALSLMKAIELALQ